MAKDKDHSLYRHNIDAEKAVLGGILGEPSRMDAVLEIVEAGDFYWRVHQLIFEQMTELHKSGEFLDIVTLCAALEARGLLQQVGGITALVAFEQFQPGLMSHAKIVADCSQARKVLDLAKELTEATRTETPKNLHEQALKLAQAAEPRRVRRPDVSAADLIKEFADRLDHPAYLTQKTAIPTPYPALTTMLNGGWQPGTRPILFGARRKVGKTSLAIEIAVDAATVQNVNVLFFELELDMDELMERMVSMYSGIPIQSLKKRDFSTTQGYAYVKALEQCYNPNLRLDASRFDRRSGKLDRVRGSRTIEDIRRTVKRNMAEREVGLIVVDHLQHIEAPFHCPIFERVSLASRGLAEMTQEFGIPIVSMCQLNPGNEAPTATDTRGSQEIGNDCQALILLDRPPMRRAQKEQDRMDQYEKEEAELIVALHGSGATGTIPMRYEGAHMRWYQAAAPDWLTATRMAAR